MSPVFFLGPVTSEMTMSPPNEEPSDPQPRWVTNVLLTVLGMLTVSFWGGLIWLGVSAFR